MWQMMCMLSLAGRFRMKETLSPPERLKPPVSAENLPENTPEKLSRNRHRDVIGPSRRIVILRSVQEKSTCATVLTIVCRIRHAYQIS